MKSGAWPVTTTKSQPTNIGSTSLVGSAIATTVLAEESGVVVIVPVNTDVNLGVAVGV